MRQAPLGQREVGNLRPWRKCAQRSRTVLVRQDERLGCPKANSSRAASLPEIPSALSVVKNGRPGLVALLAERDHSQRHAVPVAAYIFTTENTEARFAGTESGF